jgi:SAM-dependent methyltransferase
MSPSAVNRLGSLVPLPFRDAVRPLARKMGLAAPPGEWWNVNVLPWTPARRSERRATAWCNICRWQGDSFEGGAHTEFAMCPRCGAVARDRFLLWCFLTRTPAPGGARMIETSPRLGAGYRTMMGRWFDYRTSDFDLGAHTGDIQLDLQDIELPDASLDVVLTAHVLEHVPDTARALSELFRVIAPGGRMYLQVPLVYGRTMVPTTPEFHADNTPVFFNFGWDLTDLVRAAGFTTRVLVTEGYERILRSGSTGHDPHVDGFHLPELVEHVRLDDLTVVADDEQSRRIGFEPPHHFATWECLRP